MSAPAAPAASSRSGTVPAWLWPVLVMLAALAVTVAAVLVSLTLYSGQTNARIDGARAEVLAEVRDLRGDVADLRTDVHALSDRMARIEGALTGHQPSPEATE